MKRPAHSFRQFVILAAVGTALVLAAFAKDNPAVKSVELPEDNALAKLKPGPGADTTEVNCMGCHSTDYIVRQPGGDAEHWRGEVNKMIKTFGAPISDEDAKVIVSYLATAYGPGPVNASPAKKPRQTTRTLKEKPPPR